MFFRLVFVALLLLPITLKAAEQCYTDAECGTDQICDCEPDGSHNSCSKPGQCVSRDEITSFNVFINPDLYELVEEDKSAPADAYRFSDEFEEADLTPKGNLQKDASTKVNLVSIEIAKFPDPTTTPHTRTKCVDWLIIGKPYCDFRGCGTEKIKTCKGWKTEIKHYQNSVYLVVKGPNISKQGIKEVLKDTAVNAAVLAAIEYASGGSRGFDKFKNQIRKELVKALGIASIDVKIETKGKWGKWSKL